MSRKLILQGDGRNLKYGPLYYTRLLRAADEGLFKSVLEANGLPDNESGWSKVHAAGRNLHQVLGPLHCKINPLKDTRDHWFSVFEPLLRRLKNKVRVSAHIKLSEAAAFFSILMAAYREIRTEMQAILMDDSLAGRIDAKSLLFFLEFTLPLIIYLYDGVFKGGAHEIRLDGVGLLLNNATIRGRKNYKTALPYLLDDLLYLKSVDHPLRHLGTQTHMVLFCVKNVTRLYVYVFASGSLFYVIVANAPSLCCVVGPAHIAPWSATMCSHILHCSRPCTPTHSAV